jgi:hypothetical protein
VPRRGDVELRVCRGGHRAEAGGVAMGLSLFNRSCRSGYTPSAPAPNPDPRRWQLLDVKQFDHAHVLTVRYLDCTNFEGIKVMVFRGRYAPREAMDPHFSDEADSPIARFRPDADGVAMAVALAKSLKGSVERWERDDDGSILIGGVDLGARVAQGWEGRYAGRFQLSAWWKHRGRIVPRTGRRYFATEAQAVTAARAWLTARLPTRKRS